jgi:hypothetical protein
MFWLSYIFTVIVGGTFAVILRVLRKVPRIRTGLHQKTSKGEIAGNRPQSPRRHVHLEFVGISLDTRRPTGVYLAHHEAQNSDPCERGGN